MPAVKGDIGRDNGLYQGKRKRVGNVLTIEMDPIGEAIGVAG